MSADPLFISCLGGADPDQRGGRRLGISGGARPAREVQTLEGGIVEEIRVSNGDMMCAGDVLLRLDPTLLRINLDIHRHRLVETRAEIARLTAKQAGADTPRFDYDTTHIDGLAPKRINRGCSGR